MTNTLRRTIEELRSRYQFEPELADIYVEGLFDKEILTSYCRNGCETRTFYEIDTVDIPADLLITHGLTEGRKQRIIVLARELSMISKNCAFICLVDRDLDHWFGDLEATPRLKWLEFCSIEMFFFSEEIIYDIVVSAGRSKIDEFKNNMASLVSVLSKLYSMRLADRELGLKLEWIDPERCLTMRMDCLNFNEDDYISRLLNKNGMLSQIESFCAAVKGWRLKLAGDCRRHIRGHDFVDLLAWTIKKCGGIRELSSVVSVERMFVIMAAGINDFASIFQMSKQSETQL